MKTRQGFVSNSSSSSFIVPYTAIGSSLLKRIQVFNSLGLKDRKHKLWDDKYGYPEGWDLELYKGYLIAGTSLNNLDLVQFLKDNHIIDDDITVFGTYTIWELRDLKRFIDNFLTDRFNADISPVCEYYLNQKLEKE